MIHLFEVCRMFDLYQSFLRISESVFMWIGNFDISLKPVLVLKIEMVFKQKNLNHISDEMFKVSPFLVIQLIFISFIRKPSVMDLLLAMNCSELSARSVPIRFPLGDALLSISGRLNKSAYQSLQLQNQLHVKLGNVIWFVRQVDFFPI